MFLARGRLWPSLRILLVQQHLPRRCPFRPATTEESNPLELRFRDSWLPFGTLSTATVDLVTVGAAAGLGFLIGVFARRLGTQATGRAYGPCHNHKYSSRSASGRTRRSFNPFLLAPAPLLSRDSGSCWQRVDPIGRRRWYRRSQPQTNRACPLRSQRPAARTAFLLRHEPVRIFVRLLLTLGPCKLATR